MKSCLHLLKKNPSWQVMALLQPIILKAPLFPAVLGPMLYHDEELKPPTQLKGAGTD